MEETIERNIENYRNVQLKDIIEVEEDYHEKHSGYFTYEVMEESFNNEATIISDDEKETIALMDTLYNEINKHIDDNDWNMAEIWGCEQGVEYDTILVYWK